MTDKTLTQTIVVIIFLRLVDAQSASDYFWRPANTFLNLVTGRDGYDDTLTTEDNGFNYRQDTTETFPSAYRSSFDSNNYEPFYQSNDNQPPLNDNQSTTNSCNNNFWTYHQGSNGYWGQIKIPSSIHYTYVVKIYLSIGVQLSSVSKKQNLF